MECICMYSVIFGTARARSASLSVRCFAGPSPHSHLCPARLKVPAYKSMHSTDSLQNIETQTSGLSGTSADSSEPQKNNHGSLIIDVIFDRQHTYLLASGTDLSFGSGHNLSTLRIRTLCGHIIQIL